MDVPATWEEVFKHKRFTDLNTRAKTAETALETMTTERDGLQTKLTESASALQAASADLATLKDGQTDFEKMQTQLEELRGVVTQTKEQAAAERLNALRIEVATKHGLPLAFAPRLKGADETELAADAAMMAEFAKPTTPGVPPMGTRQPPTGITAAQMSDPVWIRENTGKVLASAQS